MADVSVFDRQIGAYLRANILGAPVHMRIGCFCAKLDAECASEYLSYAVPDDGAAPDENAITELVEVFASHNRRPRLEYIPGAAPLVEPALYAAGFVAEGRYPIMACTRVEPVAVEGIELRLAWAAEEVASAAKVSAAAFEEDTLDAGILQAEIDRGGLLAMAMCGTETAGVAMATAPQCGVVEIVGIGVAAAFRRRGIGGALTGFVTAEAFARGATMAWLTPRSGAAQRVYENAGFTPASEQLHISLPG